MKIEFSSRPPLLFWDEGIRKRREKKNYDYNGFSNQSASEKKSNKNTEREIL